MQSADTSLWVEDLSIVWQYIGGLKLSSAAEIKRFLYDHPEELVRCRALVRYCDMNQAALALFGISDICELQEKQFLYLRLDSVQFFGEVLIAILEGQPGFQGEIDLYNTDGSQKKVLLTITGIKGDEDLPGRLSVSCTDITSASRKKNETREIVSFLEKMSLSVKSPLFVWDPTGTIIVSNQPLTNLTGLHRDKLIGKKIHAIFPDEPDKIQDLIRNAEACVGWEGVVMPFTLRSGQLRKILWNSTLVTNSSGEPVATIAQGLDITGQQWAIDYLKRNIIELTQKNDELEEMRSQLEESNQNLDKNVRRRTKEIEELLRQKDEFISQIGHDLKTPLTPILAITPVLLKKESDPKKKAYLEIVSRNAIHLHALLTSVFRIAYLNKAYMPRIGTEIPVFQMINELIINFEFEIMKKRLTVENLIPDTLHLYINPIDFDTIFGNLLDNAIKYTSQGGSIRLTGNEAYDGISITIIDSGIGLLPEEQNRIFDTFYKGDPSRHNTQSYGLGLSEAKEIIERNGGCIRVESEGKDKGSSFVLFFPANNQIRGSN